MKKYGYNCDVIHGWAIFEIGSEADPSAPGGDGIGTDKGGVVGTSEWVWMNKETARRIVAALNYFEGVPTEVIENLIPIIEEEGKDMQPISVHIKIIEDESIVADMLQRKQEVFDQLSANIQALVIGERFVCTATPSPNSNPKLGDRE